MLTSFLEKIVFSSWFIVQGINQYGPRLEDVGKIHLKNLKLIISKSAHFVPTRDVTDFLYL